MVGPLTETLLPLVVLVGPTASGKTALALYLAEEFEGEIVSCDSVAVYRGLEIGSAKPSFAEREQIPHHLIDVASPDQPFTAGDYSRLARKAIAGISARGRLPIVTGGTGLYLRALIEGLFPAPPRQEELRDRLRRTAQKRGAGWLHHILSRLDPKAAALIHANDVSKVVRAIEVSLAARQPLTELWQQGRDALTGYKILRIGLNPPRALLYERINRRAAAMFERGLVEETKQLVEQYGYECRSLSSLGYAEAVSILQGSSTAEDAVKRAQQGHRNYAKRQGTWFRREPEMHWLIGFGEEDRIAEEAKKLVYQIVPRGTL